MFFITEEAKKYNLKADPLFNIAAKQEIEAEQQDE